MSISVGGFVDLAQQCMKEAAGITETPVLQDGTYEAKGEPTDGYTDQVNMTVKTENYRKWYGVCRRRRKQEKCTV